MRILGKSGNEVLILSTPNEKVHQGDYLQLEDTSKKINILAQIYEETYIDIPGLSEEILRDEVIGSTLEGIQGESLEIKNISSCSSSVWVTVLQNFARVLFGLFMYLSAVPIFELCIKSSILKSDSQVSFPNGPENFFLLSSTARRLDFTNSFSSDLLI